MKPSRLLVIAGEPLHRVHATGFTVNAMARYYNPCGAFAEVRMLNVFQEAPLAGFPHAFLEVPADAGLQAWRDSMRDPWQLEQVSGEMLRRFFKGVPAAWLAAIREFAPDCIRGYDPGWPGMLAIEIARALKAPVLVSVHNTMGICDEVVQHADTVMCVSEAVAQRCIELGAPPQRVVTMPDRVDRELFSPTVEPAKGPEGHPRLLSVAREHKQKNLDALLAACELARRELPELRLVHIGRGSRDWGKYPFVSHMESVPNPEIAGWMRWADALLLPSLWEGFGIVLAEALSCGTPCITSNLPPMNEIVTDRWDGLLVDPASVADIARAIREIADPVLRTRLAAPARTSTERYDIARVEWRESALYDSMLRKDWPLLSVVLPTYNRARLVEKAVRNALEQDYPNLELIVVNDGSKDDTAAILARLAAEGDARLRFITRENGGLPTALNTGFEQARGDFWTWTSDDNSFRPGALKALARELLLDPEAGLVYADMQITDEHGNTRLFQCGPPQNVGEKSTIGLCFLYRASIAREVGGYDAALRLAEDYDYWLRMHKRTKFVWLPRVLYDYGDVPFSLTRTEFHSVHKMRLKLLQREFGDRPDWAERRFQHLLRFSAMAKQYGLVGSALRTSLQAIGARPTAGAAWKALARALTPGPLLRLTRRMRGLNDA